MKNSSLKAYETDSSQLVGKTEEVYNPKEITELVNMVKKIPQFTIRAGGTGLAGGTIPLNQPVIDLSKLDKILDFNKDKKTVTIEAGVILDDLQDFLKKYDLEFPINPSSHAICTIGGMISTNAVGSRAIKYGRTSDWVMWIDVINPKGEIERKNKAELLDYSGMEGVTGIIITAGLKLSEKKERTLELIKIKELKDVIQKVKELKQNAEVSMIEFLDMAVSKLVGLPEEYHLFVEFEKDGEKGLESYNIRDRVYPKLAGAGHIRIEDPKVMLDKAQILLEWLEENKIPTYGHISVGILHPCFSKRQEKLIPEMMRLVKRISGQITGEHGIGLLKKEYVDPNDKKILINIKKRLDESNKFNPGKVI